MEAYKLNVGLKYTLQEIADEYRIDIKTLQSFHNKYCKFTELLPLTLPQFIDVIYLPKEVYENKQNLLIKSSKLELPTTIASKDFGVIINFSPKNLEIHYKVNIKKETSYIEIKKNQSYINNKQINKVVEQMFEKIGETLFPLKLSLKINGEIDKIINVLEIQERWNNKTKPDIAQYYVEKGANKIISLCNSTFQNLNSRIHFLQNNIFYSLFFLPIYQTYPNYFKEGQINIYFSELRNFITYTICFNLEKEYSLDGKIILNVHGEEEKSPFNENKEKGKVQLIYKLNKNHEITSITGFFTAYNGVKQLKIEIQVYELKNS